MNSCTINSDEAHLPCGKVVTGDYRRLNQSIKTHLKVCVVCSERQQEIMKMCSVGSKGGVPLPTNETKAEKRRRKIAVGRRVKKQAKKNPKGDAGGGLVCAQSFIHDDGFIGGAITDTVMTQENMMDVRTRMEAEH